MSVAQAEVVFVASHETSSGVGVVFTLPYLVFMVKPNARMKTTTVKKREGEGGWGGGGSGCREEGVRERLRGRREGYRQTDRRTDRLVMHPKAGVKTSTIKEIESVSVRARDR